MAIKRLPPVIQKIYLEHTMHDSDFFGMLNALDWSRKGDDNLVLEPLIEYLSQWPDEVIFTFQDKMSELLYALDDPAIAKDLYGETDYILGDAFLYARCVAMINGKAYYNAVLNRKKKIKKGLEFEAILSVPVKAWERKHKKSTDLYPYISEVSYETGSNIKLWSNANSCSLETRYEIKEDKKVEYLVSGWESIYFILTPSELSELTAGFHFVINNAHVPIAYVESSADEYLKIYQELFQHLLDGEKLVWSNHHSLFQITGLTTNLGLCKYGRDHEYQGEMYKSPTFEEPSVNLSPFPLVVYRDKNDTPGIMKRGSYIQYPEYVVGLVISYPKKIQYKINGAYEPLKSTELLASYQDFQILKKRLRGTTTPLCIEIEHKKLRPGVRVGKEAKGCINNFYFFADHHVTIR